METVCCPFKHSLSFCRLCCKTAVVYSVKKTLAGSDANIKRIRIMTQKIVMQQLVLIGQEFGDVKLGSYLV